MYLLVRLIWLWQEQLISNTFSNQYYFWAGCLVKVSRRIQILSFVLILVIVVSVFSYYILTSPTPITSPSITHYGAKVGDSGANLVGIDLNMFSPITANQYAGLMPLNFSIHWIVGVSAIFGPFVGIYSYRIDGWQAVKITPNEANSSDSGFKYDPTFSYTINTNGLGNGRHTLTVSAGLYFNISGNLEKIYSVSSLPVVFQVQH